MKTIAVVIALLIITLYEMTLKGAAFGVETPPISLFLWGGYGLYKWFNS